MKKYFCLLLAVIMCFGIFVSCGKQNVEPSATPEVAEEKYSDEDIAKMKENAAQLILTQEDMDYLVEFAMNFVSMPEALSSVSNLCKNYTGDDEWKSSMQTLSAQINSTYENAKKLAPTENCKEIYELSMAGFEAANLAVEKIGMVQDKNDPILNLADDYFEICNKYIGVATEYITIALESQPAPNIPLEIEEVALSENSIGTPQISFAIHNIGEVGIDAVDVCVEARNAYGEAIKPYGNYSAYNLTYQEDTIEPGKSTPPEWTWTLYGADDIKTVRVAVQKYHTVDGNTVTIRDTQLQWSEWIG